MMDSSTKTNMEYKRAKLPRKRKKACIKAMGRAWYYNQIKLFDAMVRNGVCNERVCKFWKNDSVTHRPILVGGQPRMVPIATRFW